MGGSFNSEDIKDLENTLLRDKNRAIYKKKYVRKRLLREIEKHAEYENMN